MHNDLRGKQILKGQEKKRKTTQAAKYSLKGQWTH